MHANVPDVADTSPIELHLKLMNHAKILEREPRPRCHVDGDPGTDHDFANQSNPLSAEVLNWQAGTEHLQYDLEVRNDLTSLSARLCPSKNILFSLYDTVTRHCTFHQWRREPH